MIYVGIEERITLANLESGAMHCPRCTRALADGGFVGALWEREQIVYFCWCGECGWMGEITEAHSDGVIAFEPERAATTGTAAMDIKQR